MLYPIELRAHVRVQEHEAPLLPVPIIANFSAGRDFPRPNPGFGERVYGTAKKLCPFKAFSLEPFAEIRVCPPNSR